jgi:plastocyanin
MKLRSLRIFAPLAAIVCAGIVLAACGSGSGYGSSSSGSTPAGNTKGAAVAPTAKPASGGGATSGAHTVNMVEGAGDPNTAWKFDPATITVKTGDTVVFMNTGSETHTATADDNSFDTHAISAGQQTSVTMAKAGTFTFHCSFHPWMKGTITVTDAGGAAPAAANTPAASSGASNTAGGAAPAPTTPNYSSGYGY